MGYYSRLYQVDVMMVPICSNYMMGIIEAAWATEKVRPKHVIPCHYGAIPTLGTNPEGFKERAGLFSDVVVLQPGVANEFDI